MNDKFEYNFKNLTLKKMQKIVLSLRLENNS